MARHVEKDRQKIMGDTRRRLLQAAAEQFAAAGFAGANINTISTNAGFAKGTVYNYFPSKHDLLIALLDETAQIHLELIQAAITSERDPVRRVERFYRAGFDFVERHLARARVLFDTINGSDEALKAHIFAAYQPMFRLVATQVLAVGLEGGHFRGIDVESTAMLLMTIYLGTAAQHDAQGHPWLDPGQVSKLVLHGLCKDGGQE